MYNYLYELFCYTFNIDFFVGCKSDKKDYIRCDEVRTILSFPEEIELKNPSVVPVDLTRCVDIIQADSLMICKKADGE